jgi:hypothetical protein
MKTQNYSNPGLLNINSQIQHSAISISTTGIVTLPIEWNSLPTKGFDIILELPIWWPISASFTLENCISTS